MISLAGAGFLQRFVDLLLRLGQIFLAAVGSSEALSNLLALPIAFISGGQILVAMIQIRPAKACARRGEIDIHG